MVLPPLGTMSLCKFVRKSVDFAHTTRSYDIETVDAMVFHGTLAQMGKRGNSAHDELDLALAKELVLALAKELVGVPALGERAKERSQQVHMGRQAVWLFVGLGK